MKKRINILCTVLANNNWLWLFEDTRSTVLPGLSFKDYTNIGQLSVISWVRCWIFLKMCFFFWKLQSKFFCSSGKKKMSVAINNMQEDNEMAQGRQFLFEPLHKLLSSKIRPDGKFWGNLTTISRWDIDGSILLISIDCLSGNQSALVQIVVL